MPLKVRWQYFKWLCEDVDQLRDPWIVLAAFKMVLL